MESRGFIDREESNRRHRAALISIFAALGLVALKLGGAFFTNSLALYSEAGHSLVDGLAALVTLIAVRMAGRPPDRDHHFGHAKYESVGALVQLLILAALCGVIVHEAVQRLRLDAPPIVLPGPALAIMILSLGIEGWRTMVLTREARRSKSEALAASSIHFMTDFLDSIAVILGLTVALLGYPRADSIAGLFVAAVIFVLTLRLGRDVVHSLTDRAPAGQVHSVEELVLSVPFVRGVHDIRIRQAGSQMFAEMHVNLDPDLSLDHAHTVLDEIEHSLQSHFPTMHVVTHPEPWAPETAENRNT